MPKTHDLGKTRFIQLIDFPVKWEWRLWTTGWTQETEEPFRTASPTIFRLPNHRALVYGKWTGAVEDEETALNNAIQGRVLSDEDFEEGWEPPAYQVGEEDSWDIYA